MARKVRKARCSGRYDWRTVGMSFDQHPTRSTSAPYPASQWPTAASPRAAFRHKALLAAGRAPSRPGLLQVRVGVPATSGSPLPVRHPSARVRQSPPRTPDLTADRERDAPRAMNDSPRTAGVHSDRHTSPRPECPVTAAAQHAAARRLSSGSVSGQTRSRCPAGGSPRGCPPVDGVALFRSAFRRAP